MTTTYHDKPPSSCWMTLYAIHTRWQGYLVRGRILFQVLPWKRCKFWFHVRPHFIFSVKQEHVATIFIIVTCVNRNTSSIIRKKHGENWPLQVTILLSNDTTHTPAQGYHYKWQRVRGKILVKVLTWRCRKFFFFFNSSWAETYHHHICDNNLFQLKYFTVLHRKHYPHKNILLR